MTTSVHIQHADLGQLPELLLDGRKVNLDAVRRVEYRYVPGAADHA